MKKILTAIALFILCLPLNASSFIIMVNGTEQTIEGTIETVDGVEYITSATGDRYKVNSKVLVGDMDSNNQLNTDDIMQIVNVIGGRVTNYQLLAANANRDANNAINTDDVMAVVNFIGHSEALWIYEVEMVVQDDWIIGTSADQAVDQA